MKDITGRNPLKKKRGKAAAAAGDGQAQDAAAAAAASATPGEAAGNSGDSLGSGSSSRQAPARRKAPTDSTNVAFEEWLRGRRPRDFLAEQVRGRGSRPDRGYLHTCIRRGCGVSHGGIKTAGDGRSWLTWRETLAPPGLACLQQEIDGGLWSTLKGCI